MILGIQHCGNHFARDLFGWSDVVHTNRTDASIAKMFARYPDEIIVTPLRDPTAVWESWYARYEDKMHQRQGHPDWNTTTKIFNIAWQRLQDLSVQYPTFYLPLDSPDRNRYLTDISRELGRQLDTIWARKHHLEDYSDKSHRDKTPVRDLQWIYDLPVVSQYYGR